MQVVIPVCMRDLQAQNWFWIVQNRAVNTILGTTYNDKCVRGIFPMERNIIPEHLAPDAKLINGTEANMTTLLSPEAPKNDQNEHQTTRVARLITILAETESLVVFVSSKCCLMNIERTQTARADTENTALARYSWGPNKHPISHIADEILREAHVTPLAHICCFRYRPTAMFRGTWTKQQTKTHREG